MSYLLFCNGGWCGPYTLKVALLAIPGLRRIGDVDVYRREGGKLFFVGMGVGK